MLDPLSALTPLVDFLPQARIFAAGAPPLITKGGNGAFQVVDEGEWAEGFRERHGSCCASPYRNRENLYSGNRRVGVLTVNVRVQPE